MNPKNLILFLVGLTLFNIPSAAQLPHDSGFYYADTLMWLVDSAGSTLYDHPAHTPLGRITKVDSYPTFFRADVEGVGLRDIVFGGNHSNYCLKPEPDLVEKMIERKVATRAGTGAHSPLSVLVTRKSIDGNRLNVYALGENSSDKHIGAFKGRVHISDLFGDLLVDLPVKEFEELPAGEMVLLTFWTVLATEESIALAKAGFDDLRFFWQPEQVVFTDGTTQKEFPPE